jgi:hypothetical protein
MITYTIHLSAQTALMVGSLMAAGLLLAAFFFTFAVIDWRRRRRYEI